MFDEMYASIPDRLAAKKPPNGFNLEDLFSKDEWSSIGNGHERQQFGIRFSNEVKKMYLLALRATSNPTKRAETRLATTTILLR